MNRRTKRLEDRIVATREQIALQESSMRDYPAYPSAAIGLASLRRRLVQLEAELEEILEAKPEASVSRSRAESR